MIHLDSRECDVLKGSNLPTYEYKCDACGHAFEKFQQITAAAVKKCPECGKSKVRRLISAGGGMIFKGSGFYITDYRSEGYSNAAKAESAAKEGGTGEAGSKEVAVKEAGAKVEGKGEAKAEKSEAKAESKAEVKAESKPVENKTASPATAKSEPKASKSAKK